MVKTEFYVAGGDKKRMSTKLSECTKICEIEGLLYDYVGSRTTWVSENVSCSTRYVLAETDLINSDGVIRRIIFSTDS
jgi:hypothetical protein